MVSVVIQPRDDTVSLSRILDEFKDGWRAANMVKCGRKYKSFTFEASHTDRHLDVYRVHVNSQNEAWVWCSACDNLQADVAEKQLPGRPSTSAPEDCPAAEGGLVKLASPESRLVCADSIAENLCTARCVVDYEGVLCDALAWILDITLKRESSFCNPLLQKMKH
jgi:hypothetical protein